MIVQEMSSYLHYNPSLGEQENQVTACGRMANAEDDECILVSWTTVLPGVTCPLCIAAIECRDRRVYNE